MMIHTFGVELMDQWNLVSGEYLERKIEFDDFHSALNFLNQAAGICEEQNHHAEFILSYGSLIIKTWSHDVGKVTERDYRLAQAIEELV